MQYFLFYAVFSYIKSYPLINEIVLIVSANDKKIYNTPNSISLFTDLFVGKNRFSEIYLRGNYKGTEYCRVGSPCLGENYPTSVAAPGFYGEDDSTFYTFGPTSNTTYFKGYSERVDGAPYFFQTYDEELFTGDNIPRLLTDEQNIEFV